MAVLNLFRGTDPVLDLVRSSTKRKKCAEKRLRFYHAKVADDLYQLIAQQWLKPEEWRIFQINILRKIIHKTAMVYRVPAVRQFEGWNQDLGDALYRNIGAAVILKKANRLTKLLKTCALQVGWSDELQRPLLSVIGPHILDVEFEIPEAPTRYVVTSPGASESETFYSDWTATTYRRLDWRGHPLPLPGNERGVNPYGVLPFVPLFDSAPDDLFFLESGADLVEAQTAINIALCNLWRAIETQSHGQPVLTGVGDTDGWNKTGPNIVLKLPEGADFKYAVPGTPIESVLAAIEFLIRQTAVANDLAANVFELDSAAESGAAKAYETIDLLEARKDDLELWRGFESRLFDVLKAVINTHAPRTIPDGASVYVDFGEVTESLSQTERLTAMQQRVDLGIWSPVDCLMSDNPDFRTREDALAELLRRQSEASVLGASFAGPSFEVDL